MLRTRSARFVTLSSLVLLCVLFAGARTVTLARDVTDEKVNVIDKTFDGSTMTIRVMIKKEGSYVVVGGYAKERSDGIKFHKGAVLGGEYYLTRNISGTPGDEKVIRFDFSARRPPLNRKWAVKVYENESDIETTG